MLCLILKRLSSPGLASRRLRSWVSAEDWVCDTECCRFVTLCGVRRTLGPGRLSGTLRAGLRDRCIVSCVSGNWNVDRKGRLTSARGMAGRRLCQSMMNGLEWQRCDASAAYDFDRKSWRSEVMLVEDCDGGGRLDIRHHYQCRLVSVPMLARLCKRTWRTGVSIQHTYELWTGVSGWPFRGAAILYILFHSVSLSSLHP